MTTITTPINKELEEFINAEVREGNAETKAHVVRQALRLLQEDRAYSRIREAEADVKEGRVYRGDLRKLIAKLPS
jgi:Arc/MetJ-type ribon-helix-helix transcriptional regulator